jgi:autoinducer 2-degrading protein
MSKWIMGILFALAVVSAAPIAGAQSANHRVSAVDLEIVPEHLTKFLEALKENGAATIKEPGCLRYDIVQSTANQNQIFIYEVYADEAAVAFHRGTPHFKKYQEVTKDMVSKRQSRPMVSVASFTK